MTAAPRPLDPDLVEFVKALARADAGRDIAALRRGDSKDAPRRQAAA